MRQWFAVSENTPAETSIDKWQSVKKLGDAVDCCSLKLFPNVSTVLQLLLSLPVGSCSCERSFSSLRQLKTWSRTSIATDRLTALALLYVYSNNTQLWPMWNLSTMSESGTRACIVALHWLLTMKISEVVMTIIICMIDIMGWVMRLRTNMQKNTSSISLAVLDGPNFLAQLILLSARPLFAVKCLGLVQPGPTRGPPSPSSALIGRQPSEVCYCISWCIMHACM